MKSECATEQLDVLKSEVKTRLELLNPKVDYWRRRAFVIWMLTATLGASITVLAGWKSEAAWLEHRDNFILVLAAAVTVLNTWSTFLHHREHWMNSAVIVTRLRALLDEIDFKARQPALSQADVNRMFHDFKSLLVDASQKWTEINAPQRNGGGGDPIVKPH